jgi:peroxiredoxin
VCEACEPPQLRPDVAAEVRVTDDQQVARAYALALHDDGGGGAARIGPGYALIDDRGRVRYRTFDPGVSGNGEEIRVLVRALSGGRR